jgi:hypothetical protein
VASQVQATYSLVLSTLTSLLREDLHVRRSLRLTGLGAIGAAVVSAVFIAAHSGADERIVFGNGDDRLPNQTASEWVTYADHVVAVTAISESEITPSEAEVNRGEGLILRHVTLKVDRVLWSRDNTDQPAPQSFSWTAYGWQFKDGKTSNRVEMAAAGEPRIEEGHSYIMAIERQEARCSPGDALPGQWRGLGADSTFPFDGGVIGEGETAGLEQSAQKAREAAKTPDDPNFSLEDMMAGRSADALIEELTSAMPVERQQFGPPPSKCS